MEVQEEIRVNDLKGRKASLVKELIELKVQLTDFNLTDSRFSVQPEGTLKLRSIYTRRTKEIEAEIVGINKKINAKHSNEKKFNEVLRELLGGDFLHEIFMEAKNRFEGGTPNRLLLPKDEKAVIKNTNIRKRLKDYHNMIIEARKAINTYIWENEPEINKADFLKSVSRINKCLPTIAEIERDKSIYNI